MTKKRKLINQSEHNKLQSKIKKYGCDFNEVWNSHNVKKYEYPTHSWFDMNMSINNCKYDKNHYDLKTEKLNIVTHKCSKQTLLPNEHQKEILLSWMNSYAKMYNETLKVLKQMQYEKQMVDFSFMTVRTDYMKKIKDDILNKSGIDKNTKIPSHTLDCAIKDVCTSFKSAFTNLRNKNIKHFTIRYIKQSKPQRIIKLEQSAFGKNRNTFCPSVFGEKINTTDGKNFSDVECGAIIFYNSRNNRFTLLKPIKIIKNNNVDTKMYDYIGLDPGIRTFLTGYSKKHVIEIGKNLKEKVSKQLKNIDNINNSKLSVQRKEHAGNKRYEKIKNLVNDLQWKTIKHLTDTYKTILIGNMSTVLNVARATFKTLELRKMLEAFLKLYQKYSNEQVSWRFG